MARSGGVLGVVASVLVLVGVLAVPAPATAAEPAPVVLTATAAAPLEHRTPMRLQASGFDPSIVVFDTLREVDTVGAELWVCDEQPVVPHPGSRCRREVTYVGGTAAAVVPIAADGTVDHTMAADRYPIRSWMVDCATAVCTYQLRQAGGPTSTVVTPTWAAPWAPFASPTAFVDRMATKVLGAPLPTFWRDLDIAGLTDGTRPSVWVLSDIAAQPTPAADVGSLYEAILRRRPDAGGLDHWVERLRTGTSPGRLGEMFANTPEVRARHEGLGVAEAVVASYAWVLGRGVDDEGLWYWASRLAQGLPRYRMIASMGRSPEARAQTQSEARTTSFAHGLYGRPPTAGEWEGARSSWFGDPSFWLLATASTSPEARALAAA